ncbi:F0F1 ATP synthase subunit epsilon [Symmachiella dynata]|uniref:F0F1 ATP synthase subunit epsilon n=1 Tax=Symmachiella dynata TaxID=2527995 RepID=UPI0030EED9A1
MAAEGPLRLVVVTPEKTVLEQDVVSLRFALYDGQIGILPGRAPLLGRLGYGELQYTDPSGNSHSYFIDGGFVQVNGPVVSILTNQAIPAEKVDADAAQSHLEELNASRPSTDEEFAAKDRDLLRTRQMIAVGRRF